MRCENIYYRIARQILVANLVIAAQKACQRFVIAHLVFEIEVLGRRVFEISYFGTYILGENDDSVRDIPKNRDHRNHHQKEK